MCPWPSKSDCLRRNGMPRQRKAPDSERWRELLSLPRDSTVAIVPPHSFAHDVVNWLQSSESPLVSKVSSLADPGLEAEHSAASVISVQNLVHRYENRTALNGVSFDVRPAELFGLLGPERQWKDYAIPNSIDADDSHRRPGPGNGLRCRAGSRQRAKTDWRGVSGAER